MPEMNTEKISREKSNLGRKNKTTLQTLSHEGLLRALKKKCALLGVQILIWTEPYTTRRCSKCLHLNPKVHGKTFHCQGCHAVLHRDGNAAMNILRHNLLRAVALVEGTRKHILVSTSTQASGD
ncbi:hypothetical protein HDU97_009682 [Phlyctochytrium planicorne]|nr:hypothetical protein HDU97_009682 [Phlyctochytrium planicorne]